MRWPRTREIWLAATLTSALLVWASRHFVNPDGVSYLDLSDDIASGRFASAVNGHWSPAYPALLALWLGVLSPHPYWEATAVHVLNGLLFLASMATFQLFLRELAANQSPGHRWALDLNNPAGRFAAWSLFLWCAFVLITIRVVTPDMMLSAILWAIAALVARIHGGRARPSTWPTLGALLGLSYLTKSIMFPLSLVIIVVSLIAMRRQRGALRHHAIATAVFLAVSAPQVITLSSDGNGIRYSDSGWLAYALKVNHYPKMWTGIPPGSGVPEHPIVQAGARPAMFVFPDSSPDRTYPVWNDPATWFRGMDADFDVDDQATAFARNIRNTAGFALKVLIPLVIVAGLRKRGTRFTQWPIVTVACVAIAAYLGLNAEPRLVGPWFILFVVSVMAATEFDEHRRGQFGRGVVHAITIVAWISTVTYVIDRVATSRLNDGWNTPHYQWRVAERVKALGARPGSRVALVGDESDIYWARLSDVQVAVQIPLGEAPAYWQAAPGARDRYERMMAKYGVKAMVSSWTNPPDSTDEWKRVGGTMYSVSPLDTLDDIDH